MEQTTGKLIKNKLKELRHTQSWLAEIAGVSINAVSKWTQGGNISPEKLPLVARALGITIDQLLKGAAGPALAPVEQTSLERLTADEKDMLELYRGLNREGQLMVKGAARASPKATELRVLRHKP